MAEKATIARPYARAAFAHARGANALAAWGDTLNTAAAVIADVRAKKMIGNPKVSPAQMVDFIAEVLGGNLDSKIRNFFDELTRNRRLNVLPEVASMFAEMRNEVENVADVQITSAVALNDAQRSRFAEALKKRLKKEVRLSCDVDASLVGGAVIRSGDLVIDGSLRARLEGLNAALTN
ncbi:MAG TPA: F0F1 ATP synthase subunit delta [Steroidobacteraceae bacterium]|nr:F0F1 ATP synthase subunit delta [Steroidobacteraceae bacterium]